ncbi:alpha/beta hydrolase family esterase [Acuticoccus mangrovi]|uniref:Prolyl oligopeptidase family serine peptidase n=1 Tax=Acuticoccus mangrovi TaxID=2796142 RepID=A0A934IJH2_9HYPH|nr:prolyl oligopeptidase family serine peptidase [Acuticoccus mangrovi]MBJ3777829.1 prolyl oligopeptidase family serine peptidase [Acuticoccus mangrovi]
MRRWLGKMLAAALLLSPTVAMACGPTSDCVVGERAYRIAMPDRAGPIGSILYFHGYGGTAAGVMNDTALRAMAERLGVALIAPQGLDGDWQIAHAPRSGLVDDVIEVDAVDAILADAEQRFALNPQRRLAAGFSAGGMMTWTLACRRPETFSAFVAISGTFWDPLPDDCAAPPRVLMHVHGTADRVVPLAGRPIADTMQGNVADAFARFEATGGFTLPAAHLPELAGLACEGASRTDGGEMLICLHKGGHEMRPEWIEWAYTTFVAP